jgi:hypothetical protein
MQTYTLADLKRIENKLANPIDPEREAWEANRYRYASHKGEIHKVKTIGGGSGYTGTFMETLYASGFPGNNLNTFTTEVTMYAAAAQSEAILPANFFDPTYGYNKTLRITARGIYSTTATPTFTVALRQDTASGGLWGSSLAVTGQSTVTNLVWELECDTINTNAAVFGGGHNETNLFTFGMLSGVSTGSNGFSNASSVGTQTPTTTFVLTTADASHYLVPTITCGTSNAANKWQMLQLFVFGCN